MEPQVALALLLSAVIGLSLGLLGSGGSIITLPVLVYVVGLPAQTAVAMSLVVVGAVSAVGGVLHLRNGHFHSRAVLFLGFTGMAGAYFGSALTRLVNANLLMLIFAALMLAVGAVMLRNKSLTCDAERCYPARCLLIGAAVGALTGFLGVGGGFLIVPALVLLAGIDAKNAVGASLGIIALNSASGLIGQLRYAELDWILTAEFTAIAMIGMWAGALFVDKISQAALRQAFAWSVVGVGVIIGGRSFLSL